MDSVCELYVTQGTVSSYNFLHLTCQEFLAAVHISNMKPEEQLQHFKRHKEGKLRMVLKFLAGVTNLMHINEGNLEEFLHELPEDSKTPIDVAIGYQVSWIFEAQREDLMYDVDTTVEFRGDNSVDYYSLGYCISNSRCRWVLSLVKKVGEEDIRMLLTGTGRGGITDATIIGLRGEWKDFCFRGLAITIEALNMLFTELKDDLSLHELALRPPAACDIIKWPDLSALVVLTLEMCGNNDRRLDSLLSHLSLQSLTIASYTNGKTKLLNKDCVAIAELILSATCLKEFCMRQDLDIGNIFLDEEGFENITLALVNNQSLQLEYLELSSLYFNTLESAVGHLIKFLTNTTTLRVFTSMCSSFVPYMLLDMAQLMHQSSTLFSWDMDGLICYIYGDGDANDFAQLLLNYPDMRGLMNWSVMEDNGCYVFQNVSDAGATSLAKGFHHMEGVCLSENNIGDSGAKALAHGLHHNSTLEALHLADNNISDAGAIALAHALHHNSKLKILNLYGNGKISKEGTCALVEAIAVNSDVAVTLPEQCREFAVQCVGYDTVKDRINFF